MMHTLKVGDRAYYDSMSGPVPCKVLGISPRLGRESLWGKRVTASTDIIVSVQFEKTQAGYTQGQIEPTMHALYVFPASALRRTQFGHKIQPYGVQVPEEPSHASTSI